MGKKPPPSTANRAQGHIPICSGISLVPRKHRFLPSVYWKKKKKTNFPKVLDPLPSSKCLPVKSPYPTQTGLKKINKSKSQIPHFLLKKTKLFWPRIKGHLAVTRREELCDKDATTRRQQNSFCVGFYKTKNTVGSIHLHWRRGDSTTEACAIS